MQLLALWHARRRELDELLEPLLSYGPVAVSRVVDNLAEVTAAADNERAAFEAFLAAQELTELERGVIAEVGSDELTRARQRFTEAKAQARRFVHPSVTEAVTDLPNTAETAESAESATIHRLPIRGPADED